MSEYKIALIRGDGIGPLFWDMAVCVSLPAPLRRRCGWSRRTSAG